MTSLRRLMFISVLPPPDDYLLMMQRAQHAFALLQRSVAALPRAPRTEGEIEQDALFVWSSIHGLVSAMNSDVFATLDLSSIDRTILIDATLARNGASLANAAEPLAIKRADQLNYAVHDKKFHLE